MNCSFDTWIENGYFSLYMEFFHFCYTVYRYWNATWVIQYCLNISFFTSLSLFFWGFKCLVWHFLKQSLSLFLRFLNPLVAEFLNSEGSWMYDDPFGGLYWNNVHMMTVNLFNSPTRAFWYPSSSLIWICLLEINKSSHSKPISTHSD